jgi:hypothetical protein
MLINKALIINSVFTDATTPLGVQGKKDMDRREGHIPKAAKDLARFR